MGGWYGRVPFADSEYSISTAEKDNVFHCSTERCLMIYCIPHIHDIPAQKHLFHYNVVHQYTIKKLMFIYISKSIPFYNPCTHLWYMYVLVMCAVYCQFIVKSDRVVSQCKFS